MIRRTVKDPETAAALVPHYPDGLQTRDHPSIGYFDTFNRPPNVIAGRPAQKGRSSG